MRPAKSPLISSEYIGGGAYSYRGASHELIAAGVALPEWFPDGEKPWKTRRRIALPDGGMVIMSVRRAKGQFEVLRYPRDDVRYEAWEREHPDRGVDSLAILRATSARSSMEFERFMARVIGGGVAPTAD